MIRFWRTPVRKIQANSDEIVSPADGRVISVQHFNAGEIPETAKNRIKSRLEEFSGSELLANPFRMISINMTLLDVHKNCAPLSGEIILNKHTSGKFLSLKNERSLSENERNSYIIQSKDPNIIIGIVQIASRLVRRIDSYVKSGEQVNQGDWLGMIRFGSQVDVILPSTCQVLVSEGMQVYAAKTVIAEVVREEI
jgi:phosphatidylserine decarboxylase